LYIPSLLRVVGAGLLRLAGDAVADCHERVPHPANRWTRSGTRGEVDADEQRPPSFASSARAVSIMAAYVTAMSIWACFPKGRVFSSHTATAL
jgi:hypothetical protein